MYEFLKMLLEVAESIGNIEQVDMGKWLHAGQRVEVQGSTQDGKHFELRLTVEKEEADA